MKAILSGGSWMPASGRRACSWTLAALLAAAGCAEELGVDRPPTAEVRGSIRIAGRPVRGGWVEFIPLGATLGNLRTTPLGPDGTFRADGVPVGEVVIGLAHPDPGQDLVAPVPGAGGVDARGMFHSFGSPIRRTIPPGGLDGLDIDLADEAIAAISARRAGT